MIGLDDPSGRGSKARDTAARFLGLHFRIPLGKWMSVCCQVEISATGRSLVQRSPTDCGVSLCVIKKPQE